MLQLVCRMPAPECSAAAKLAQHTPSRPLLCCCSQACYCCVCQHNPAPAHVPDAGPHWRPDMPPGCAPACWLSTPAVSQMYKLGKVSSKFCVAVEAQHSRPCLHACCARHTSHRLNTGTALPAAHEPPPAATRNPPATLHSFAGSHPPLAAGICPLPSP